MMIAPASEIEFFDTWYVSGLCGTGSTDFAMNDLFVPEARAVGLGVDGPLERPLYAFPQFGLLAMGIAAVAAARALGDRRVGEIAGGRRRRASRARSRRVPPPSRVSLSEALALVRAFYTRIDARGEPCARDG